MNPPQPTTISSASSPCSTTTTLKLKLTNIQYIIRDILRKNETSLVNKPAGNIKCCLYYIALVRTLLFIKTNGRLPIVKDDGRSLELDKNVQELEDEIIKSVIKEYEKSSMVDGDTPEDYNNLVVTFKRVLEPHKSKWEELGFAQYCQQQQI